MSRIKRGATKSIIFTRNFQCTCYLNLPVNDLVQVVSVVTLMKGAAKRSETFEQTYYATPALLKVSPHSWLSVARNSPLTTRFTN